MSRIVAKPGAVLTDRADCSYTLWVQISDKADLFRKLPSVDELLRSPQLAAIIESEGHSAVTEAARSVLASVREAIASGAVNAHGVDLALSNLSAVVERQVRHSVAYSLRRVINATGVILHTNLGRAPLGETALQHIAETATGFSNLEFNLDSGERGKRDVHVDRLFARLLMPYLSDDRGISSIVVNNNAAAVMIALNTLAEGGEVIVSRGELVEIGGSFRVPDVMSKSNASLREVGTTNRTRISDYEHAINDRTKLLMRVHRSNFQIVGFTEQPSLEELVALGRKHGIPVMEDLGSGALFDLREVGIANEPGVGDSIRAGVDLVTYSGDKLLGGPQAGVISGTPELVSRIRSNPLFRALRVDKLILAALEATLLAYTKGDFNAIPAVRMMRLSPDAIRERAESIAARLSNTKLRVQLFEGESVIGGGAAPGSTLPTVLLGISSDRQNADHLANELRHSHPPVVARVDEDRLVLDLRTVSPEEDEAVLAALLRL
ncbi:MAG TPA: L-seryl-tRNA(Sec) selenium transferase [Terriglobales bacterium]|nr:L-seryl-tRNA(Sec) selenium transferase [Terriglobales bacterium]